MPRALWRRFTSRDERFNLKPEYLAADTAYGSAETLNWIVNEKKIAPHIPLIDRSKREDGTFSRGDFTFDKGRNIYVCPAGKLLKTTGRILSDHMLRYTASTYDFGHCPLKSKCCPNTPQRMIPRHVNEDARDVARALAGTDAFEQSRRGGGDRHDRHRGTRRRCARRGCGDVLQPRIGRTERREGKPSSSA